jgi:hypothetical protein
VPLDERNWLTPAGTIIRSKKQIRRPPEGPLRNRPEQICDNIATNFDEISKLHKRMATQVGFESTLKRSFNEMQVSG